MSDKAEGYLRALLILTFCALTLVTIYLILSGAAQPDEAAGLTNRIGFIFWNSYVSDEGVWLQRAFFVPFVACGAAWIYSSPSSP